MESKLRNILLPDFGRHRALRQQLASVTGFFIRPAGCPAIHGGYDIDYDVPLAAPGPAATSYAVPGQALPANTVWRYAVRAVTGCGLESAAGSPLAVVAIDAEGDGPLVAPNAPQGLTVAPAAGGTFLLRFRYLTFNQAIAPASFKVYADTGSGFNFAAPLATLPAPRGLVRQGMAWEHPGYTTPAYAHALRVGFVVRACAAAGGQLQNINAAYAVADDLGPPAPTGLYGSYEVL
jgi:hypothetical protein